jgi:hypothetical protein
MPSHPDRVRRNYCDHEWHRGVDIADFVLFKCFKCGQKYYPGISKINHHDEKQSVIQDPEQ